MAMIDVSCPSCGETYHVAEQHVGRSLRCRRCDRIFEVAALPNGTVREGAAGFSPDVSPTGGVRPDAPAASPVVVTDQDFEQAVLRSPRPVVVDFWAPWCGPCRAIAPAVEQLATEYGGRVTFAKLNADENPRTMTRFGVMGLPTLVLFKGGREVRRLVGAQPKAAIQRAVAQLASP
jgi:thioredoxin